MYRTFIVPLDGSELAERAISTARHLAGKTGGRIVAVSATIDDYETAYRERHLKERLSQLGFGEVEVRAMAAPSASGLVIETMHAEPDPLVVMSTHGRTGLGAVVVGSTSEEIIRRSDLPVLLVGPECDVAGDPTAGNLVVPVDGSDASEEALVPAMAWVNGFGLTPWIVSVVDPEGKRIGKYAASEYTDWIAEHVEPLTAAMGVAPALGVPAPGI